MKIISYLLLLFGGNVFGQSQENQLSFSLDRDSTKSIVILHSVKKFPCRDYMFDMRDFQNADTTIFVIMDFLRPANCTGPRDVAKERFVFTPSSKRFYLQFRYKGKRDMWRIFQHDTTFFVKPEGATFSTYIELPKPQKPS